MRYWKLSMKKKIEKVIKKVKIETEAFMEYARASFEYMQKYFKEGDFANARIEAEDAAEALIWISQELEAMARLKELLEDEGKD